ncbi:uncharacterized protein LOC141599664 isoform X1 [Silene latifolia]|uniref:uncharacterized protein LOC141599664 isoform X1 n=1 Tax=Silene latifolia TaxID=37657 RepID=UPI003D77A07D
MATSSISVSSPSLHTQPRHRHTLSPRHTSLRFHLLHTFPALQASRRSNPIYPQGNDESLNDGRRWRSFDFDGYYGDEDDDDEEEEEEDRSLDLLVRFVENVFRKVSKRARKAVRSVLPLAISTKLVGFAVNGLLILSFLWVLKAFLEVICTLGTVVFVSIIVIRGVWSGILYLQDGRGRYMNGMDDDQPEWTRAQPAT